MTHQDYEREALQDRVFLLEEEAELEKDYYLWLEKQNYDNSENKATIREGIGPEFVFDIKDAKRKDRFIFGKAKCESEELVDDIGKKRVD